jgi:hypothetical protein
VRGKSRGWAKRCWELQQNARDSLFLRSPASLLGAWTRPARTPPSTLRLDPATTPHCRSQHRLLHLCAHLDTQQQTLPASPASPSIHPRPPAPPCRSITPSQRSFSQGLSNPSAFRLPSHLAVSLDQTGPGSSLVRDRPALSASTMLLSRLLDASPVTDPEEGILPTSLQLLPSLAPGNLQPATCNHRLTP